MNVRRRNINNRLSRDLQLERGAHNQTRALFQASQDALRKALDERDAALTLIEERDRQIRALTEELGAHFSEPPLQLSRNSLLFRVLQEIAPRTIPALRPTPADFLLGTLNAAGATYGDLEAYARSAMDSAMNGPEDRSAP